MAKVTQVIMQACHDPESDVKDCYIIQGVDDNGNALVIQKPASSRIVQKAVERFNEAAHAYLASARTDTDKEELQDETDVFLATLNGVNENGVVAKARQIVTSRLERLTDRITCDGFHVYYDNGDFEKLGIDPVLENHLIRIIADTDGHANDDRDVLAWCRFTEKLYSNPNRDIVGRFVAWMQAQNWLTLTDDGNIIGYRGCMSDDEGEPASIHEGPAIVNGVTVKGHVPNHVGDVVEFDRTQVTVDYSNGCARGLHVGTYDYAVNWGRDWLIRVELDPRDVVSVPFDCGAQKVRCCRFKVLDKTALADLKPTESWRSDLTYGDGNDNDYDNGYDDDNDGDREAGYDAGYDACCEALSNSDYDASDDVYADLQPTYHDVEVAYGDCSYSDDYNDGFNDGWYDAIDDWTSEHADDDGADSDDKSDDASVNVNVTDSAAFQNAIDDATDAAVAAFNDAMDKLRNSNR